MRYYITTVARKPMGDREAVVEKTSNKLISDVDNNDIARQKAARRIERWWGGVKNKKIFKIFKQALCSVETSLTRDIVRKLCSGDAELLQDSAVRARVKFRLGGERFPPDILYKIFFSRDLIHTQYISGKTMIRPSTEAAEDASRQMGHRVMFDQMITDACYHPKQRIRDEIDVATVKDYMQYKSVVDESPAYIGGKGNSWRTLDATSLPRHSTMRSVVELLAKAGLRGVEPRSGSRSGPQPSRTRGRERIHFAALGGSSRSPPILPSAQLQTATAGQPSSAPSVKSVRTSSRRSVQARERVDRMRQTYMQQASSVTPTGPGQAAKSESAKHPDGNEDGAEELDWEDDALMLYQWTKGL